MYTQSDYNVGNDSATTAAIARVLAYLRIGEAEQQRLVDHCARNIPRDRYVHPKLMSFSTEYKDERDEQFSKGAKERARLCVIYDRKGQKEAMLIHRHALSHLCEIAGLDGRYRAKLDVDSADAWRRDLLATNLKELFAKQRFLNKLKREAEFLHRIVGNELRAVLTQSYNRHLVSTAVLQPFLAACQEVGLQPAKATVSDMKVHLQTYLPFAFQPVPGEFVAIGTCWTNSDFGEGKLRISHSVLRLNGGGNLVTEDAFSRMHIGSVVQDTDMKLSDEVAIKELEAVAAATRSAVLEAMTPDRVNLLLRAIQKAAEEKVPWYQMKDQLAKILSKGDLDTIEGLLEAEIEDLPPPGVGSDGQPLPSRWWAAAALSHLAEKTADPTKAMEIKAAAGSFLNSAK